jgi:hypothetical protein
VDFPTDKYEYTQSSLVNEKMENTIIPSYKPLKETPYTACDSTI